MRLCVRALAVALVAAIGAPWSGGTAWSQLSQEAQISTDGTQFVAPPTRPTPPTVAPAAPPIAPAPPVAAPPRPMDTAVPVARFPSVVILLDTSDSMLDKSSGKEITHLDEARNAIAAVIRGMSSDARVQVWHFNSRMYPVTVGDTRPGAFVPVGDAQQRDELIGKLRTIRTSGVTNLYESLVKALELFAVPADQALYRNGQRFPVLVVVSDGEDSGTSRVTLEQVQEAKRKSPLVTVNAIGFTVAANDPWFKTLCQIATRREGCATADDQTQLRAILDGFYRPSVAVR